MGNWENFSWGNHEECGFIRLVWLYNAGRTAQGRDKRQEES